MGRTCVFCASSPLDEPARRLARELGRAIAAGGDDLVYGGTATGLMAEVAAGAREGGGRVVGVVPAVLRDHPAVDHAADELVEVASLGQRKEVMVDGVDRVVTLPGGLGTLDELLEVLTMRQLGLLPTDLDVVVLDPTGHFGPLRDQLDLLVARGATRPAAVDVRWASDVAGALRRDGAT